MKISGSDTKNNIFFSVIFLIGFLLSASFMPYVSGVGFGAYSKITADLLFAISIVSGILYDNRKAVSIMALVAGVFSDIFLTPPVHLSPVLFLLGAYFATKAVSVFTRVNAFTVAVSSIPFFLARAVTGCVFLMSGNTETKFGDILKLTIFPEFVCNILCVFFVYLIVGFIYKRFKRRFYI